MRVKHNSIPIRDLAVASYTVPTDFPESDGTAEWDRTTMVVVRAGAADQQGLGYTYADEAAATLINGVLAPVVKNMDALSP